MFVASRASAICRRGLVLRRRILNSRITPKLVAPLAVPISLYWVRRMSSVSQGDQSKLSQGTGSREKKEESTGDDEKGDHDIVQGFVVALAVVAVLWGISLAHKNGNKGQIEETDSSVKRYADTLSGECSVPNAGRINRVKQEQRLSLNDLAANGVSHAKLEGTIWKEPNGQFYQQTYWNDEAAYQITAEVAAELRSATYELHSMCLEAVDLVVGKNAVILSVLALTCTILRHVSCILVIFLSFIIC